MIFFRPDHHNSNQQTHTATATRVTLVKEHTLANYFKNQERWRCFQKKKKKLMKSFILN